MKVQCVDFGCKFRNKHCAICTMLYVEILNNNNFNESVIYYKDINEDNSIDFRIKFEKQ